MRSPALFAASSRSIPMTVQSTRASSRSSSTRHCTSRSEAHSTGVVPPIRLPFPGAPGRIPRVRIDVVTIFPGYLAPLDEALVGRAGAPG